MEDCGEGRHCGMGANGLMMKVGLFAWGVASWYHTTLGLKADCTVRTLERLSLVGKIRVWVGSNGPPREYEEARALYEYVDDVGVAQRVHV